MNFPLHTVSADSSGMAASARLSLRETGSAGFTQHQRAREKRTAATRLTERMFFRLSVMSNLLRSGSIKRG